MPVQPEGFADEPAHPVATHGAAHGTHGYGKAESRGIKPIGKYVGGKHLAADAAPPGVDLSKFAWPAKALWATESVHAHLADRGCGFRRPESGGALRVRE